jgi:hypothetical protein
MKQFVLVGILSLAIYNAASVALGYVPTIDNQTPFELQVKFNDIGLLKPTITVPANSSQSKNLLGDCMQNLELTLPESAQDILFLNRTSNSATLLALYKNASSAFPVLKSIDVDTKTGIPAWLIAPMGQGGSNYTFVSKPALLDTIFAKRQNNLTYAVGIKHLTVSWRITLKTISSDDPRYMFLRAEFENNNEISIGKDKTARLNLPASSLNQVQPSFEMKQLEPKQVNIAVSSKFFENFCQSKTFTFGYYEKGAVDAQAQTATWTKKATASSGIATSDQLIFACLGSLPNQMDLPLTINS